MSVSVLPHSYPVFCNLLKGLCDSVLFSDFRRARASSASCHSELLRLERVLGGFVAAWRNRPRWVASLGEDGPTLLVFPPPVLVMRKDGTEFDAKRQNVRNWSKYY
ncbi:uncharacterized protein LOC127789736 [Diospyros lotus]|uniref:uncharacterized protein LOC127789736 n=1 Tax=Diospyros lotus TaxID=55363 RepID=UPI00225090F7|nr:uncharacterized protein LOC127789736 [Diospyros lotus]